MLVKGVWAWRRIRLASEVGQYLGCISDEVEGKRLESGLSRKQEVHGDLSLARQLVDAGREHLHNAAESSRNAVALLRNDDILVPSAQVTNGEEHNNAGEGVWGGGLESHTLTEGASYTPHSHLLVYISLDDGAFAYLYTPQQG